MPNWPYDDPPDPSAKPAGTPTWDCPDGKCACAPVEEEEPEKAPIAILLRDDLGERMRGGHCRIWHNHKRVGDDLTADGDGWVRAEVPVDAKHLYLEWAPSDLPPGPEYPIRKPYLVEVRDQPDEEAARRRLANLGFSRKSTLSENVADFQVERGIEPVTGSYHDIKHVLADYHDEGIESGSSTESQAKGGSAFVPARFEGPGDSGGGSPKGGGGGGGNNGTAQFSMDFPTPIVADAQGKTFHEFQTAGTSVFDPQGKEWDMHLLVSRDALKWEVPTATVRGKGVDQAEGQYWERTFKDLTNPDPIIPAGGLDPKRTIRLPTTAENAQKYANATSFTVAALLNTSTLQYLKKMGELGALPSNDRALPCLLPTPLVMDVRYEMQHQPTQVPCPSGKPASSAIKDIIPDSWKTNNDMNALYTSYDVFVCNPGKIWAITNRLYDNPHTTPVRHQHTGTKQNIACNYGWHVATKGAAGTSGAPSGDKKGWVIQPPQIGHDILHKDYSQVVILVAGWFALWDPYASTWSWQPTEDLYLSKGAIKAAETAHGVKLSAAITTETLPLITASTL